VFFTTRPKKEGEESNGQKERGSLFSVIHIQGMWHHILGEREKTKVEHLEQIPQ
jgi:hypothetical protein